MLTLITLLALAAAQQLISDQYVAVRTLLADLGCTAPRCPDFAANATCPSVLSCANGRVVSIDLVSGLTGSIHGPSLGVLTDLTSLRLYGLSLKSTIPTQVGRLAALTSLILFLSGLTGTVPSQVGTLRNLRGLSFANNRLTGTLPSLELLTRLLQFDSGANMGLSGTMPSMPTSLRSLSVHTCSFTALPPNLLSLTGLIFLNATRNRLSGRVPPLPSALGNCTLQLEQDTNCFACPVSFSSCFCNPNACASPTTSVTAATVTTATPTTATTTTSWTAVNLTNSDALEPWVLGVIVGGAVLALLLVGLAIGCILKRRARAQAAPDDNPSAAEMKQQSNYAAINVAAPPGDYDQGRFDSNEDDDDQQPAQSNNYAVIPGSKSVGARDYDSGRIGVDGAAAASDYAVGRLS
jgi:hypothetical protein